MHHHNLPITAITLGLLTACGGGGDNNTTTNPRHGAGNYNN
ncbi:hypothetical protein [Cardiobacterium valvarum]|uniref:Uncharacterized protein n=1 Tax=Cardiobacterium valvarum TaxID=194702 RepID=A0A381EBH9_9GAMM|nr:hypothetical protein [Cardiobacterium valvarum]SUX24365.1 Uncharacterised protein [Cardiobacterium valvarum]